MKKQNLYKYLFLISLFYPLNSAKADDSNCYSNQYVGTVGASGTVCANMLIVDRDLLNEGIANGADLFKGEHIHFGSDKFPDWESVCSYLL